MRRADDTLREFPLRGRRVPESGDPRVREMIVGDYRLIYPIDDGEIGIVGVIHGARNLMRLLEERERPSR